MKSQTEVYLDYRNQATQQWNDVYSVIWLEKTGVHPLPTGGSPENGDNLAAAMNAALELIEEELASRGV